MFLIFALQSPQVSAWEAIQCIAPINKNLQKHWMGKIYQPVLDPQTIPVGSPYYFAVLEALERMNRNPSQFRYVFGGMDKNPGIGLNNGESEIYMKDLGAAYANNSAIEESDSDYSPNCTATESDIVINSHYRLQRTPSGISKLAYSDDKRQMFVYGGSHAHLVSTIMHELGHSAGLHHEGDVMNLMGGNNLLATNGDRVEPYIGEDAANGLIALHGLSAQALEDVSVSHWRYGDKLTAKDGSIFSLHNRTRLLDADHNDLPLTCPYRNPDLNGPLTTTCPEPVYKVHKGQTVKLEFTFENSGKTSPIGITAHYVLSTDANIDDSDRLLFSKNYSLKRDGQPSTVAAQVKLPNSLTENTPYWLGCRIKTSRSGIKESNENNNSAYVGIKIEPGTSH
ncbi:hypothetical protein [Methylosoma difficile]